MIKKINMNKDDLYIHIGTHKTGTTAIQQTCKKNAHALKREGIIPLSKPTFCNKEFMKINKLDEALVHSWRKEIEDEVKRLKIEAESYQYKDKLRFLLSWEGFSGNPDIGYQNSHIVANTLQRITYGFNVYILVFLRRKDSFLESWYTQKIHVGYSYEFEDFLSGFPSNAFRWDYLLEAYEKAFSKEKIIVRIYDKKHLPQKNDLIKTFFNIFNLQNVAIDETFTSNKGYSRDSLEIAKLTNPYLEKDEQKKLRKILQNISSKETFSEYNYLNYSKRIEILNRYRESNKKVRNSYFPNYRELFSEVELLDSSNNDSYELSIEKVSIILTKAILSDDTKLNAEQKINIPISIKIINKMENKIIKILKKIPFLSSKLKQLKHRIIK